MSWKSFLEIHQQRRKMSKATTTAWSHAEQTLHFRKCLFKKANIISQFQRQMKSPYNRSCRSSAVQFVSQYIQPQNISSMNCAFQRSKATNRSQRHLNVVCITSTSNNVVFASRVPSTVALLSFFLKSLSLPQILLFSFFDCIRYYSGSIQSASTFCNTNPF